MRANITATLNTRFGLEAFWPGQAEAIQNLLAGQHTLVVMPTGAGKSLVYQLASLHRPGLTLVISPLIALMQDQVTSMTSLGIPATYVNSTLPASQQNHRLRAMAAGDFELVYVAPERLRSVPFQEALSQVEVGLLAVDEAHCISQWGHDFRPDYRHIAEARPMMDNPVTVALTATATPKVQDDIVQALDLTSVQRIVTGFNRPNLTFAVRHMADPTVKLGALHDLLINLADGAAIVYVGTRRDAEEVAEFLRDVVNLEAAYYHAGLDADTRYRLQEAFLNGRQSVMVATNAFGMGIDRPDVRLVVHYAMPGTLEAYYQEAGRAGRDGEPAQAVLLYAPQDRALQEWFIETSTLTRSELRTLYESVHAANGVDVWTTASELSFSSNLPSVRIKVGLAQLEAAGALERLGDKGMRMLLRRGEWDEAAIKATFARSEQYRRHRQAQLAQVIAYAESDACRRCILLAHFGDRGSAEAIRCCDNCLATVPEPVAIISEDVTQLSRAERTALIILDTLRNLSWNIGRAKLAQILQGSQAKEIKQFDYDQNPYYGRLSVFTQKEIRKLIGQLIEQSYLKTVGGSYPVLSLTPQGEAALQACTAIPLRLPHQVRKKDFSELSATDRTRRVFQLGEAGSPSALPELIAALEDPNGNVRRLAASALGKIGDARAVTPLLTLLAQEQKPQVRQYAVKALGKIGDPRARPVLQEIAARENERDYTRKAARNALGRLKPVPRDIAPQPTAEDEITAFLARPHPRLLVGSWDAGWALDFHSRFTGADWDRSQIGELAFRFKYRQDRTVLPTLVEHLLALCTAHPRLTDVDALVPVPPSKPRAFDPVRVLADALGTRLDQPVWPVLAKTRLSAPQKELRTLAQKKANVAGAFVLQSQVRGKRLLVLDDLYDSGATLEEVTRVLRRGGAVRVYVLTLTRTIHADA
jgi:ATP-dependent DNA helicase RecQ